MRWTRSLPVSFPSCFIMEGPGSGWKKTFPSINQIQMHKKTQNFNLNHEASSMHHTCMALEAKMHLDAPLHPLSLCIQFFPSSYACCIAYCPKSFHIYKIKVETTIILITLLSMKECCFDTRIILNVYTPREYNPHPCTLLWNELYYFQRTILKYFEAPNSVLYIPPDFV